MTKHYIILAICLTASLICNLSLMIVLNKANSDMTRANDVMLRGASALRECTDIVREGVRGQGL